MKFSIKDFFSKCDLMENFIVCIVFPKQLREKTLLLLKLDGISKILGRVRGGDG